MPQDITLRVGALTATIELTGTPTKVQAALLEFFEEKGIPMDGTNQEKMVRFLEWMKLYVQQVSKAGRQKKIEAAATAAVKSQVDTEVEF